VSDWIDISMQIAPGMPHWPGDPDVELAPVAHIGAGDACNVSRICMGTHTGTHIDPPLHYFSGGKSIAEMPLDVGIGPCRVLYIPDVLAISAEHLRPHSPQQGERLLLRTCNSERDTGEAFRKNFAHLTPDAAQLLADAGVRLVGIDYMSIGSYEADGEDTHRILLGAGLWVIENLVLSGISAGEYEMLCLPLRIAHGDGGPCRAAVRKRL
jgi:arylformamidase